MRSGAGGRTPGTALHGNARTPATGARNNNKSNNTSPASHSSRPGQNPLSTVAAATTRPSRFMQGAARGGPAPGQRPAAEETPATSARMEAAVDSEVPHGGPGPTSGRPLGYRNCTYLCTIHSIIGSGTNNAVVGSVHIGRKKLQQSLTAQICALMAVRVAL